MWVLHRQNRMRLLQWKCPCDSKNNIYHYKKKGKNIMRKFLNTIKAAAKEKINSVKAAICRKISTVKKAVFRLAVRSNTVLVATRGENFVDSGIKILIAVVIGALLLGGLYALFGDTIMPTVTKKVQEMFAFKG